MSVIRRQSIISSVIIYLGIGLGALNTFLYGKWFTPAQYGLFSGVFVSFANIMYAFAHLGTPNYILKFYPYYKDNTPAEKNDMATWALLTGFAGFLLVTLAGLIFKPLIIRKFGNNSAELVHYYYWLFPFGLGLTLYSLLEAYGWQVKKAVLTNYLREVQWRLFNLVLMVLFFTGILGGFDLFLKLYSFTYLLLAGIMLVNLVRSGDLHFVLAPSRVTKKFFKKIRSLLLLTWPGNIMFNLSFFIPQIVIAAVVPDGLTAAGIFTFGQLIASFIQAPQRGIIAATISPLSHAWKDKDYGRIQRIYARSSINQLIFSIAMFLLIWLNFTDAILTFHQKIAYLDARYVFLFIGLTRVIDMGTGVNSQIIGTSVYWRFELFTGILLILLTLPLTWLLATRMGALGPAVADLITFSIYNGFRWGFLYWKFGLQPFTVKTLYPLFLGLVVYAICYFIFHRLNGLVWIIARSLFFVACYGCGVIVLRLSEDVAPVWNTVKKRLGLRGAK